MSEPRCELTDLLVSQCGCKDHRNSPEVIQPDLPEPTGYSQNATRESPCPTCHRTIKQGQTIFATKEHGFICSSCRVGL